MHDHVLIVIFFPFGVESARSGAFERRPVGFSQVVSSFLVFLWFRLRLGFDRGVQSFQKVQVVVVGGRDASAALEDRGQDGHLGSHARTRDCRCEENEGVIFRGHSCRWKGTDSATPFQETSTITPKISRSDIREFRVPDCFISLTSFFQTFLMFFF